MPTAEQARISKQRAGVRKLITNYRKKLNDWAAQLNTESPPGESLRSQINAHRTQIDRYRQDVAVLDDKYSAAVSDDFTEQEWEAEVEKCDEYQQTLDEYDTVVSTVQERLKEPSETQAVSSDIATALKMLAESQRTGGFADDSLRQMLFRLTKVQESTVEATAIGQLPAVSIKKFSGDCTEFLSFMDEFRVTVHERKGLTDIQRFKYLKSFLKGDALEAIASIPLTEENYQQALQYLSCRYGKTEEIVIQIFAKLLELSSAQRANNNETQALRQLVDKINNYVLTLKSLKFDQVYFAVIMYPALLRAIPRHLAAKFMSNVDQANASPGPEQNQNSPPGGSAAQTESPFRSDRAENLPNLLSSRFSELREFLAKEISVREKTTLLCDSGAPPISNPNKHPPKFNQQPPSDRQHGKDDKRDNRAPAKPKDCVFCGKNHFTAVCPSKLPVAQKLEKLRVAGLCQKCFWPGHKAEGCKKVLVCKDCKGEHYRVVCGVARDTLSCAIQSSVCSLLPTGHVEMPKNGKAIYARFLLDSGSQSTFVCADLVKLLGLRPIEHRWVTVRTFGERAPATPEKLPVVELILETRDSTPLLFKAFVVPTIVGDAVPPMVPLTVRSQLNCALAELPTGLSKIEILFGASDMMNIISGTAIRKGSLTLMESKFGFIVVGDTSSASPMTHCNVALPKSLHLEDFWALEHLGIAPEELVQPVESDATVMEQFRRATTHTPSGCYSTPINFDKAKAAQLADNRAVALKQVITLIKRLRNDPELGTEYRSQVQMFLEKGYAEKLPAGEIPKYFLPHFPVVNSAKDSFAVRPVFNASSKAKGQLSLNDAILDTPNLLPTSVNVLLRFRLHQVPLVADISKAYLAVQVHPEFRNYLCFFWSDELQPQKLQIFRMASNTFGVKDAQFNTIMVIRDHASKFEKEMPRAVQVLKRDLYMDDLLTGAGSVEEVIKLKKDVVDVLEKAGMQLKKFRSTSSEVADDALSAEPTALTAPQGTTKVLGLNWLPQRDIFTFPPEQMMKFVAEARPCLRTLLGAAARLYDPLGLLSPFVMQLKLIIQACHEQKLGFDKPLPPELAREWAGWTAQLRRLADFSVPRFVANQLAPPLAFELHAFADASGKAYAAAVYLRATDKNGISQCHLLTSKARLVPLKGLKDERFTIPRKELTAALCAARLLTTVSNALGIDCTSSLWSDSVVVLGWINSGEVAQQGIFVENRVREIRKLTQPSQWRHICGSHNPADLPSRGTTMETLLSSEIWYRGPTSILSEETSRPSNNEASAEALAAAALTAGSSRSTDFFPVERFSSLQIAVRVMATVMRACRKFQSLRACLPADTNSLPAYATSTRLGAAGPLLGSEIQLAKQRLILEAQQRCFGEESDKLKPFAAFQDESGLWRVGGRLESIDETLEVKHPLLLADDPFTTLLIRDMHERGVHHLRTDVVLAALRRTYWIIRGRQLVKKELKRCSVCKRYLAKAGDAVEGLLPPHRLESFKTFQNVGLDFMGPLRIRAPGEKVWVMLVTCQVTRAIYLDIVPDMSTHSFLLALKRFISTHGLVSSVTSDNALTFVKASKVLKALWVTLNAADVQNFFGQSGITWKFNAPRASWWGGHFERLIGVVKSCLRKALRTSVLPFFEFLTLLKEVEAAVNSRPLTYLPSDEHEARPLTPCHFLGGRLPFALPSGMAVGNEIGPKTLVKLWRQRERVMAAFWKKWKAEYVLFLRSVHRRRGARSPALSVGDIVIIHQDGAHRQFWRLGRVEKLFLGRDGEPRTCEVKTAAGSLVRPVQLLFKLLD